MIGGYTRRQAWINSGRYLSKRLNSRKSSAKEVVPGFKDSKEPAGKKNTSQLAQEIDDQVKKKNCGYENENDNRHDYDMRVKSSRFAPQATLLPLSKLARRTTWLEALDARNKQEIGISDKHQERYLPDNPELFERTMQDSFTNVNIPFSSDKWLLDLYVNAAGKFRIGNLFQDLDALAGIIAYKHVAPYEPTIVTASVDRVYLLKRLSPHEDITLSGNVTWTGKSSMEIFIKASTVETNDTFLTANFTFVARDPRTNKAYPVNKLIPKTEQEIEVNQRAAEFHKNKKLSLQKSLEIKPPDEEESQLIHELWVKYKDIKLQSELPTSKAFVNTSVIKSTSLMQPQYRNRHSYMIFGGYLLRQTFELAYACAAAFSHQVPRFVSLDSTAFRAPVPVGSVLYLTATVVYTTRYSSGTLIQVMVDSLVRDISHGTSKDCGNFVYTYFVEGCVDIIPQSYEEDIQYLEGRRRTRDSMKFQHAPIELVSE